MARPTYTARVIVVRKTKLGESDLILSLLTEDGSQLRAVAKGARKPKSSFASRLELFSVADILCAKGRSLDVVSEARLVEGNAALRNDIERASHIARKMVTVYGMSDRLGSISFESGHDEIFIGRSMAQAKPYSEQVAAQIDEEVKSIVDAAYERCEDILSRDQKHLIAVAEFLLAHETMSAEEFEAVFTDEAAGHDKI